VWIAAAGGIRRVCNLEKVFKLGGGGSEGRPLRKGGPGIQGDLLTGCGAAVRGPCPKIRRKKPFPYDMCNGPHSWKTKCGGRKPPGEGSRSVPAKKTSCQRLGTEKMGGPPGSGEKNWVRGRMTVSVKVAE